MSNMLAPYIWIVDDDLVAQFNAKIKIRQAGINCNVRCFDDAHSALVELMDPEISEPWRSRYHYPRFEYAGNRRMGFFKPIGRNSQ